MKITKTARIILFSALLAGLAACENTTETVQNPFSGNGTEVNSGPPAATEDARRFEINVWNNLKAENRCGQCHTSTSSQAQEPYFMQTDDVNVAYSYAVPLVNLQDIPQSRLVTKVAEGHNCWLGVPSACADSIESMIQNWAGSDDTTTARAIQLTPPAIKQPGESKNFPASATDNDPNSFEKTVYPLVTEYCSTCHYEEGPVQQQSPFFANLVDVESAYQAARPKINIDLPEQSRLVQRLLEQHNCWDDCAANAAEMQAAIEDFAGAITPDAVDPAWVFSKSLNLYEDGIVASGGNRHEANVFAMWEFKTGQGNIAYDTSGIEPAMHLTLNGSVDWMSSYGLDFKGGKAQASTGTSKKLHDFIQASGEYSIEAWVVPANVTQEDSHILGYGEGANSRNFGLGQTLYNYDFTNRSDQSDAKGDPALSTPDAREALQANLQHVVATYDPIEGRKIYVNGELITDNDPIGVPTSIADWSDGYVFSLGSNAANGQNWMGQVRMVAIHNKVLTQEQITQNFEVGVGQKYYLLFWIGQFLGESEDDPKSFIRMEVSQFDNYSYLFLEPTFINLDPDWTPGGFTIKNLRIAVNGKEAVADQIFGNLEVTIDSRYSAAAGQLLSPHGAVIALEKGPESDEFFLTFEVLANQSYARNDPVPTPPAPPADAEPVSDIGVRTFEEINATIARMTGVPVTNAAVQSVFDQYRQQLPVIEDISSYLASHQMAVAQLALTSCSERVDADKALPIGDSGRKLFVDFDFSQPAGSAFDSAAKVANAVDPVIDAVLLTGVNTQPNSGELQGLLGGSGNQTLVTDNGSYSYPSLISEMVASGANTTDRTAQIVKAVCAAAVGSAAMLIQ